MMQVSSLLAASPTATASPLLREGAAPVVDLFAQLLAPLQEAGPVTPEGEGTAPAVEQVEPLLDGALASGIELPASGVLALPVSGNILPPARTILEAPGAGQSASAQADLPRQVSLAPSSAPAPQPAPSAVPAAPARDPAAHTGGAATAAMPVAIGGPAPVEPQPATVAQAFAVRLLAPAAVSGNSPKGRNEPPASPTGAAPLPDAEAPALADVAVAARLRPVAPTATVADAPSSLSAMPLAIDAPASAGPAAQPSAASAPQQPAQLELAALVDRLVEGRMQARSERSAIDLPHPDFGKVTIALDLMAGDRLSIDLPGAPGELRQALGQALAQPPRSENASAATPTSQSAAEAGAGHDRPDANPRRSGRDDPAGTRDRGLSHSGPNTERTTREHAADIAATRGVLA